MSIKIPKKREYKDLKLISKNPFIRNVLIEEITILAKKNKNIFFLSADMGAPALDDLRKECPQQFIHCGISEQHMISFAAGMSLEGNKIYCYALTPFITARCYEQIKCSASMMSTNISLLGLGAGLSYADAGPTHYALEDISIMKALPNISILTPCDSLSARKLIEIDFKSFSPSYIRIERDDLSNIYNKDTINAYFKDGFNEIIKGKKNCIVSSGYCLHLANSILSDLNKNIGLIDLYQHNPIDVNKLKLIFNQYENIIIIDEQVTPSPTEQIFLKIKNDFNFNSKIITFSLENKFFFQNGGRDYLLENNGINREDIKKILLSLV